MTYAYAVVRHAVAQMLRKDGGFRRSLALTYVIRRGSSCWCDVDADEGRLHDSADGCCDCRGTVQHAVRRLLVLRRRDVERFDIKESKRKAEIA